MNASFYKLIRREVALGVCLAVFATLVTMASCSRREVARDAPPVDLTLLSLEQLMRVRVTNDTARIQW